MSIWARPERGRHDSLLLAQSLDERIPDDCGVRLLDEMLGKVDWSDWEAKYEQDGRGRPPLHPRYLAGCIIYGAMKRVASLRELEEATRMRQDFMWLMDGQTADHSTFCKFRARFDDDIGGLFKQLNRRVARERKLTLEEALIDGTRLRADSDRHGARTAKVLETQLEALEAQVAEHIRAMPEETEVSTDSPAAIEERLREYERRAGELDRRRRKLERALEIARERDEAKCAKDGRKAVPVRVPVTDPESHILPNKEGGYAPNYTPVLAVESEHGLIAGVCLAEGNGEADTVAPLMEQVSEIAPGSVKRILSDSAFGTGPNLKNMDEDGIEVYSPAGAAQRGDNPAARPDPAVPVAEKDWDSLPMHGKKLDRAAFVYNADDDCYHCPMGRRLDPSRKLARKSPDETESGTEYRCVDCSDCPLAGRCKRDGVACRTVRRDAFEPYREALARRMRTEQGKKIYARRAPIGEGAFAGMKRHLGLRRFTRRGRKRVGAELIWMCIGYNMFKLVAMGKKSAETAVPAPAMA